MPVKIKADEFRNKLIFLGVIFIILMILSACGAPAATEAPAAPEAPAEPIEPSEGYPVQYGQDSRLELYQHSDSKLKEMAASVAVFVHSQQVHISGNSVTLDGYTLNEMSELGWLVKGINAPMCAGELFASQIAPGFCTGFLVKEDIVVTAGHCLQKNPCSDTSIVFGFQMESENSLAALNRDNVYRCTEVIAQVTPSPNNRNLDYAIIRLDRSTGRAGLDLATEDLLEAQEEVSVLGHPSGLPMKIAAEAFVMSNGASDPFFITNLDTFGSNSGSPVINSATYQVEGILVRGETDYVLSNDGSCVQVNRCPENGGINCAGENATKMAVVSEAIPDSAISKSNGLNCFTNLFLVLFVLLLLRQVQNNCAVF
jgi:hypothetical protein